MGENDGGGDRQWSCCNDAQSLFIILYVAYTALAILTWRTLIAKPMRLMAVFLHEMSHATACWITGGNVRQLQVFDNEGGVTRYVGGCRCLIIPAGYVGTSIWAMIFVILSGGRKTATFAAVGFTVALLVSLCYSPNQTMVILNLFYAIVTICTIFIEWYVYTPVLQFLILFFGVFTGIFAIADVYQDTVKRSIEGSDAYACYLEVCPVCPPRFHGLQWALLTIFFQCFGIWLALVEMSEECVDLGWFQCLNLSIDWDWQLEKDWHFDGFWDNGP